MLKQIEENWKFLTTIGAIFLVGWAAATWVGRSIDTLETLPEQVRSLEKRLEPLEEIPDAIKDSSAKSKRNRITLQAQIELAKSDLAIELLGLEKDKIERELNPILSKEGDLTPQEERSFDELRARERDLNTRIKEYRGKWDQHMLIIVEGPEK